MDTNEFITKAAGGSLSKDTAYAALMGFARLQKQAGQSDAQCFSRYIQSEDGRRMFAAYKQIPGGEFDMSKHVPTSKPVAVAKVDDDGVEWGALVKAYSRSYGVSENKAISQLMLVPEAQNLFKRQLRAERVATGAYSALDMQFLDTVDKQADDHREFHKINKQPLFMQLVADMRAKFPYMTQSDAMDRTMALHPDAWAQFKALGLPDPQDGAISGKPEPSRSPDWQQHARSDLMPAPKVEQMSPPNPKFKSAEATAALANFEFFAKVLFDASAKAGKHWSAEQCVDILRRCPSAKIYLDAACRA